MSRDILAPNLDSYKIMAYKFDGYYAKINSLESYYREDMRLLDKDVRDSLFGDVNRPVYTRIKDSFSTKYGDDAKVINSMVADGCIIEGTVENCILHRGVKICRGAVVKNSIIMRDTIISENASLNCVISDRNVVVKDSRILSGCEELPFYIAKGKMI
jgi:glucose-1-phosphate adenylyltransferase